MALAASHASAQEGTLKLRVSGLRSAEGKVMAVLVDHKDPAKVAYAMAPATDNGTVECTLTGKINLEAPLYVFHDADGNFNLNLDPAGVPVEGCFSGPVTLDEEGTALVELKYYAEAAAASDKSND